MTTKHTPGPWWHVEVRTHGYEIIDEEHALVAGDIGHGGNAALIAAAPELLAACVAGLERLVSELGHESSTGWIETVPAVVAMRAAIAKARGAP